jgi:hypothetical protein
VSWYWFTEVEAATSDVIFQLASQEGLCSMELFTLYFAFTTKK